MVFNSFQYLPNKENPGTFEKFGKPFFLCRRPKAHKKFSDQFFILIQGLPGPAPKKLGNNIYRCQLGQLVHILTIVVSAS